MKKLSEEEFIQRCQNIHNYEYDYSKTIYKNTRTKIIVICKKHGEFEVLPNVHLRGSKCRLCINNNCISNNEFFIEKSNIVHNNKYDYSLVDYKNNYSKVKIICSIHGIFEQTPNSHLSGNGCIKCSGLEKSTINFFIEKSNIVHNNKYDYSLVEYFNNKIKVKIICPEHGIFEQKPINHTIQKQGCPKCSGVKKLTTEEFIIKSKKIHNNLYDYSQVEYLKNRIKVKIICPEHGIFEQTPNAHLRGDGCPNCFYSSGEKIIYDFLLTNNIKFEKSKTFEDCKYINKLRFDFYLYENNICLEFDGGQHHKSCDFFGGEKMFEIIKKRDNIKNNYCLKNNIKLIRLSNIKDIKEKLKKELNLNG